MTAKTFMRTVQYRREYVFFNERGAYTNSGTLCLFLTGIEQDVTIRTPDDSAFAHARMKRTTKSPAEGVASLRDNTMQPTKQNVDTWNYQ